MYRASNGMYIVVHSPETGAYQFWQMKYYARNFLGFDPEPFMHRNGVYSSSFLRQEIYRRIREKKEMNADY